MSTIIELYDSHGLGYVLILFVGPLFSFSKSWIVFFFSIPLDLTISVFEAGIAVPSPLCERIVF